ncbi:hypothetical protein B0H66DRAFT_218272 [Apodospora peruviana]|uniref:Ankyrin repeat protein n=1 Tax=Apodospora peruviana TaxID=516989 RepID=A0AAE0IDI8_9PEZI|nr:hypothetical protein B0H66DRAFT_218272 [Apodospora peruviana]
MTLLEIVRSDAPNPVPQLIEADNAQPIWSGGKTALSNPLLRELLLVMALRSFMLQGFRLAPGAQDLVKHIALQGPPIVPHGERVPYDEMGFASEFHRRWVWTDEGMWWSFAPPLRLRRDVEAVLVRNGWRDPGKGLEHLEPSFVRKEGSFVAAGPGQEVKEEGGGMCEMVDALLHVGFLDSEEKRADALTKVARYGDLGEVKFTLGKIERGSITPAQEAEILSAAAQGGKGRAQVLQVLLDGGLDPNAVVKDGKMKVALHVAIRHGDVDMVRVLLDAGANMVNDEEWGLPIEAAEGLLEEEERAAKVAVIEQWLAEQKTAEGSC